MLAKPESRDDVRRANSITTPTTTSPSKPANPKRSDSDDSFESDPTQFDANGIARRSAAQAQKRRDMDKNMCIVLKTADPEVCHIVPHSANKTEERRSKVESYIHYTDVLLFADDYEHQKEQAKRLFARSPGCSDRKWNMVCLNRMLHKWWGDFRFGLKFLGTAPSSAGSGMVSLKVQWHWMPRRAGDPTSPLPRTAEAFIDAFRSDYGDPTAAPPLYAAARPDTLRCIRTGDVFHVPTQAAQADKTILALKIQWALIAMAAIAGGAEALDLVYDEPPDYFEHASGLFVGWAAEFREGYEELRAAKTADDASVHAGPSGCGSGQVAQRSSECAGHDEAPPHQNPTSSDEEDDDGESRRRVTDRSR